MTSKTQSTAQIIAKSLFDAGVRYIFGMPGGEVVDLIEAAEQQGMQFILMGHESAASLAAGIYGHASATPGVCLSTLGPGACNLALGIGDAFLDRHPMLAISARTAVALEDRYNHQHLDLNAMYAPITKASIALNSNRTRQVVESALQLSLTPPRGPVYLSLPGDLATQPESIIDETMRASKNPGSQFNPELLESISERLNAARHPLVVVGIALDQHQDAAAVRDFLTETQIPYLDTPKTKGLVDPASDRYLGTCLSASGASTLAEFILRSDCLLGIGFDPVESTYDWHITGSFYSLTNSPTIFNNYVPNLEVVGDVSGMLSWLGRRFKDHSKWEEGDLNQLRAEVQASITPEVESTTAGLSPFHVAQILRAELPDETRLSLDTGQHKMLFSQAWHTSSPLSFFVSNGLSSMGAGLPGAIALALNEPARPALCVTGDGGFGMMVQELETIQRLKITPLIVVLCDQALSLIRIPQEMRGYPARGIEMAPVDWAAVAEGFGLHGIWARTISELRSALSAWCAEPQALVLAVQIDDTLYRGNKY